MPGSGIFRHAILPWIYVVVRKKSLNYTGVSTLQPQNADAGNLVVVLVPKDVPGQPKSPTGENQPLAKAA